MSSFVFACSVESVWFCSLNPLCVAWLSFAPSNREVRKDTPISELVEKLAFNKALRTGALRIEKKPEDRQRRGCLRMIAPFPGSPRLVCF